MPTLLELQHAMRDSLVHHNDEAAAALLADRVAPDRLDIYRNTFISGLTKALRLCYPVVQNLVGADFFEAAAQLFIAKHPPRVAYLDQYGGEFSEFLRCFPPAASLAYLVDVARLEWAVNCALHAPDVEPVELDELAAISPNDQGCARFIAHPSIRLLRVDYPVDHIWRAVLTGDDRALTTLDIDTGPVYLLAERRATGVDVIRLDEPAWRFLDELCSGRPIQSVLESITGFDTTAALAEHLALGRFVAFELMEDDAMTTPPHRSRLRSVA
jgi:hypothetical protein